MLNIFCALQLVTECHALTEHLNLQYEGVEYWTSSVTDSMKWTCTYTHTHCTLIYTYGSINY